MDEEQWRVNGEWWMMEGDGDDDDDDGDDDDHHDHHDHHHHHDVNIKSYIGSLNLM